MTAWRHIQECSGCTNVITYPTCDGNCDVTTSEGRPVSVGVCECSGCTIDTPSDRRLREGGGVRGSAVAAPLLFRLSPSPRLKLRPSVPSALRGWHASAVSAPMVLRPLTFLPTGPTDQRPGPPPPPPPSPLPPAPPVSPGVSGTHSRTYPS